MLWLTAAAMTAHEPNHQKLTADTDQLAQFVGALFLYADENTWVSLRGFPDKGAGGGSKPFAIKSVQINGHGLGAVTKAATLMANSCARAEGPVVFCPPVATFTNAESAAGDALANGLSLSLECDQNAVAAVQAIRNLIGPPTLVIASGGTWTDPKTGEVQAKLHAHWRLTEPTRTPTEHAELAQARSLACDLVGGDGTNKNPVHPIRWPGSWHRKGPPKLTQTIEYNHDAEIDLGEALELLSMAAARAGKDVSRPANMGPVDPSRLTADPADLLSALVATKNDDDWNGWNTMGLAIWASTNGQGFDLFDRWSSLSDKYDAAETWNRWEHFATSPPTRIGAGSIFFRAIQCKPGWRKPSQIARDQERERAHDLAAVAADISQENRPTAKIIDGKFPGTIGLQTIPAKPPPERFPVVWYDDAEPLLNIATLIKGVLSVGALSVIYGESGCGKTFAALDLALHIAAGWPWFGRKTTRMGVVYIAGEGGGAIMNRLAAFKLHHDGQSYEGRLPFAVILSQVNLLDPHADIPDLIWRIGICAELSATPVGLVVVDTVSRALPGGEENSSEDMTTFIDNVDRIRAATHAHVGLVHHSGKDAAKGARGHSSLRAAIDTEMEVAVDEKSKMRTLTIKKQRDLPTEGEFSFSLKSIELGIDEDGEVVSSCVVDPADEKYKPKKRKRLTGKAALGYAALVDCIARGPMPAPASNYIPSGVVGVTFNLWRETLILGGAINQNGNPREQFTRIVVTLKNEGFIGAWDDFAWVVT